MREAEESLPAVSTLLYLPFLHSASPNILCAVPIRGNSLAAGNGAISPRYMVALGIPICESTDCPILYCSCDSISQQYAGIAKSRGPRETPRGIRVAETSFHLQLSPHHIKVEPGDLLIGAGTLLASTSIQSWVSRFQKNRAVVTSFEPSFIPCCISAAQRNA